MSPRLQPLLDVFRETRALLARQDNDFTWSSWEDAPAALLEIDALLSRLEAGTLPRRSEMEVIFLPTGPLQEVSLSSAWGDEFLHLADRFDSAMEEACRDPL
jgi:hypothetical protein